MTRPPQLARRRFLKVLAGAAGALIVGVPLTALADNAPVPLDFLGDPLYGLGAYVRIDADGSVLIGARDPDTGTGVATSLPRIIADELDADWSRVSVVPLGLGVVNGQGEPDWIYGHQLGGTGTSIPAAWSDLRQAGALARWLLLQAAAQQLGVPADGLRCTKGQVIAPDGRRLGYGELAAAASKIAPPKTSPAPKTPDQYTLIGQPAGDVDARGIVTGQTPYTLDHHVGDALVAILVHCPWRDGQLKSIDTTGALAVQGVQAVLQLKPEAGIPPGQTVYAPAVAVVADSTWAALQGRARLKIDWQPGPSGSESSAALEQQATTLLDGKTPPTVRVRDDGDVDKAGKHAARRFEATYYQPWLAHATAETMCCLARVDKDKAELVVPTQAPQRAWSVVQRLTGFKPAQIQIRVPRVGGGYGRRLDHDYVAEAVTIAKAVGHPVRLLWTRDEDITHDWYRPAAAHHISAIIDHRRHVIGWDQRVASASALVGRGVPDNQLWTSELQADQMPAGLVPNYRSDWYGLASALPRGPYRAMPHLTNAFAVECFIDELAHQLRENPLDTKLRLLGKPRLVPLQGGGTLDTGRLVNVLQLVAERIGWKQNWLHSVNGFGIACWHIDGAYVAHAIETSLQGNTLGIVRAVCAVDVGRVINPTGLTGQVAGATLDALGTALNLAITFKDGRPQQRSWKDYPLASMAQLPDDVEVIVVPGQRDPNGASFLAMPSAAPALANAVFRVSAVRVRRLPLMKELLRLL
ncbi:xanthine dehydrogenase family protein molybdopterin-binding subunit [Dyella sp. A6]|uniref:xanthine dehydrogenase family protein molybdopterin-binding subunit n=1 Tax=Dyella aluminiiresistens TaxID=3069105 RepID=UPI002E75F0E7|nr:molybdopterin cofactor-binding domain-containing protein [Dyella sp. A6]